MLNDDAEPEPLPLDLAGRGPYELPLCADVELAVGEMLAALTVTTIQRQKFVIPLGHPTLLDLHQLMTQALKVIAAGET